jgi:pimeloyl-ACP methyl ester carboxylesterase
VEDDPIVGAPGTQDHVIPPSLQEEMYERAGAQISRVRAGHLSLITRPDAVVRVILSALAATRGGTP